jgi:pyruvate/2-oxoglutarate/acetoin dehydrogenase E1 component
MNTYTVRNSTKSYVEAIKQAQAIALEEYSNAILMGLDVDDHKGIQGTTKGLVERFGSERVFTTPLSEDAMTGVAIGAAMSGLRPIHVHIRMDFLLLCMNQLINIAAKSHHMYGGVVNVPMVVRTIIGKSWGQGAQHSQGLYSMFMNVPGLKVVAPSNAYDAKGLMLSSIDDNNPVIFVEHRLLFNTEAEVPDEAYRVPIGKGKVVRKGKDVTLVGVSNMVIECLRAAELLEREGISVEVIDPITLAPLDYDLIQKSSEKTGRLIVVDNGWMTCGAGAEIIAEICSRSAKHIKVGRSGFAATPCPTAPSLERCFYPNPLTIAQQVYELCDSQRAKGWNPDSEFAELIYQKKFKGPF